MGDLRRQKSGALYRQVPDGRERLTEYVNYTEANEMVSTGLKGLDEMITGLRPGDNVVWQMNDIKDYKDFVTPYVKRALEDKKNVVYMRFAPHEALLKKSKGIKIYDLDAHGGFESFTTQVNKIISKEGEGAYYVFDCLSALLSAWSTDLMVGNFFMVTCPYLYELKTIAYFALLRNSHSFKTIARIRETTQLLLDIYNCEGEYYIHPLKVWNRYSPTMFLPHLKSGDEFTPVTDSVNASRVLSYINRTGAEAARRHLDHWDRLFLEAEDLIKGAATPEEKQKLVDQFCNIMISRDKKILTLAKKNFTLEDLLEIKSRMIGTGLIGGKAVGMLLSRKILENDKSFDWKDRAEEHDSFYIGSDVFYSYLVQNGWWKLRMQQKTKEGYFDTAAVLKEQMLHGAFPEEIMEQFQQIIEYFGQSPIIVRSSSLLEDGYGNAFAGKYESIFCANQGTPEQRYLQFADAVRRVYASTMSEDALVYRKQRGLDQLDEQMALLVQRVSGAYHEHYFFPDVAGVGVSYNTYVWNPEMDPKAGMLRVVLGLGTRSVNRVEGDYPRTVALDKPLLRPHAGLEDVRKYSQHDIDVIDIEKNSLETIAFIKMLKEKLDVDLERVGVRDYEVMREMKQRGQEGFDVWVLTFDKLFSEDTLTDTMKKMLKIIESKYQYPVDIEFTVNFTKEGQYKINLLQCRPLQTIGVEKKAEIPENIEEDKILVKSEGYFFGGNISRQIDRVVYVDPAGYHALPISGKYDIARIIGKINRQIESREGQSVFLLGPGRWGTSTPSLGVPVSFSEINNIAVLGELSFQWGNLMPELSFGTHFFQDLVETNIFYMAIFPEREEVVFSEKRLLSLDNLFEKLMPDHEKYKDIIRIYDVKDMNLRIASDVVSRRMICYFQK
jgi:hypothetical protein